MTNVGGFQGNTSRLISHFENLSKVDSKPTQTTAKSEPKPKPGDGMSDRSTNRLSELQSRPLDHLSKSEKNELSGLQRQHERPDLLNLAKTAQKTGGVLAGHAVALTKVADEKQVCICIRGVNPLATSLVENGFGTKDMSIKAKSSNLPPLNGLIPFDQSYGKKGNDPHDVEKFNHKNEEAIEKGVATKTDAVMLFSHVETLRDETKRMSIASGLPGLKDNEVLLTSQDFGKTFHFVGVKDGPNVTIYAAHQETEGGAWVRDETPVQVMANRDGKPVTADYDLAVVAPRLKDLGSEHMTSLKMASFTEVDRRTNVSLRMGVAVEHLSKEYSMAVKEGKTEHAETLLKDLAKLVDPDKMKDDLASFKTGTLDKEQIGRLGKLAAEQTFLGKVVPEALKRTEERYPPSETGMSRARDMILEALGPPVGSPLSFSEFNEAFSGISGTDLGADPKFDAIQKNFPNLTMNEVDQLATILGSALEGTESRDTGIVSRFVRDLVPELNQTVGQTGGLEVFHHGDDSGNPYSVEKDNYPMTVILPESALNCGPQIQVINDGKEFLALAKNLKNQGFALPINEMWNSVPELKDVRSDSFLEAKANLAKFFDDKLNTAKELGESLSQRMAAEHLMYTKV